MRTVRAHVGGVPAWRSYARECPPLGAAVAAGRAHGSNDRAAEAAGEELARADRPALGRRTRSLAASPQFAIVHGRRTRPMRTMARTVRRWGRRAGIRA